MKTSKRLFLGLAVAVASGCMYSRGPQQQQQATSLRVDNQSYLDMTIYVLKGGVGGQRQRIGLATALKVTTLPIPANVIFGATSLRFIADPIGASRAPITDEITVVPGDQVSLTIPPR